jgi:tripartite-type tricarboxylate transporter receptor subunit TctC
MKKSLFHIKIFFTVTLVIIFSLHAKSVLAQKYPERLIKVVIPYPAGAIGDIVMRMVGQRLTEKLGQPIVIDNRSGGGGLAATESVAKLTQEVSQTSKSIKELQETLKSTVTL